MSIYFIVDNKYSKELIIKLISIVRNKFVRAGVVHVSRPVNVCSNKMGRFIKEGLGEGLCVVIVVDTEGDKPEDVKARIIDEHLKDLGFNRERVKIITAHPCLEAWLAELLNLNTRGVNCKDVKDIIKHSLNGSCICDKHYTVHIVRLSISVKTLSQLDRYVLLNLLRRITVQISERIR